MATDHASAVLAVLQANPNLTVFDGPPPTGQQPPYVVVYVWYPSETRASLDGPTDSTTVTATTHSVGLTPEAARIVSANVRSSLIDQRMQVDGVSCTRVLHPTGLAPSPDESTGTLVMDAIDEWDYIAYSA